MMWWLLRHAIYLGLSLGLMIAIPLLVNYVIGFVVAVHVYKAVRHCFPHKKEHVEDGNKVESDKVEEEEV